MVFTLSRFSECDHVKSEDAMVHEGRILEVAYYLKIAFHAQNQYQQYAAISHIGTKLP